MTNSITRIPLTLDVLPDTGNHNNNSEDNWEILCKRCHQNHHSVRGVDGRFMSNKG